MSFNFAASLADKAAATPKQPFAESVAAEPIATPTGGSAPTPGAAPEGGAPIMDGATSASQEPPLTSNELAAQAELWVEMSDFAISRGLTVLSDKPAEEFKATADEKKTLKDALLRYFSTLQSPPQIPAWLFLLGVVLLVYGPKTYIAVKEYRQKKAEEKKAKKKPKDETKVDVPTSEPDSHIKFNAAAPEFGQATTFQKLDKGTATDPYFLLMKKVNPVSTHENGLRERLGGKKCQYCDINFANKGSKTCSALCSSRLSAKKSNAKKNRTVKSKVTEPTKNA
jgi:hypothetical protein